MLPTKEIDALTIGATDAMDLAAEEGTDPLDLSSSNQISWFILSYFIPKAFQNTAPLAGGGVASRYSHPAPINVPADFPEILHGRKWFGRPEWHQYVAWVEGVAAGVGMLYVRNGTGYLVSLQAD